MNRIDLAQDLVSETANEIIGLRRDGNRHFPRDVRPQAERVRSVKLPADFEVSAGRVNRGGSY